MPPHTPEPAQVLLVTCVRKITPAAIKETHAPMQGVVITQPQNVRCLLKSGAFTGILALIDPANPVSLQHLNRLTRMAQAKGMSLGTLSTFNPPWIENLIHKLGVKIHFRSFPNHQTLTKFLGPDASPTH